MKEISEKAFKLLREEKIKKELETDQRIHFSVFGESDVYSVIFDKEKKIASCTCKYFSLKQKECSHIIACRKLLKTKEAFF